MRLEDLNKINNLIYFTRATLFSLDPIINKKALDENISRWIKDKSIIKIKNGMYITNTTYQKYKQIPEFHEYLANVLRAPSYVTASTILRSYGVLTDATYGITSITLKRGEVYTNTVNTFSYSKIKKELFIGYTEKYFFSYKYLAATKSKALFDYLYFKSATLGNLFKNRNLVEELRLKLTSYTTEDFEELKYYVGISQSPRIKKIVTNIIKYSINGK